MEATAEMLASIATHNGTLTVRSEITGDHRTFRIHTQPDDAKFAPGERIVSLLSGSDNESDYIAFAFLRVSRNGKAYVNVWRSKSGEQTEKLARLLEGLEHHVEAGRVTVHFATLCRRCNRKLTTPESIASGIGPICADKE